MKDNKSTLIHTFMPDMVSMRHLNLEKESRLRAMMDHRSYYDSNGSLYLSGS